MTEFRDRLTRVALEQLKAQMDWGDPEIRPLENHEVRIAMGENTTAMHDRILAELDEMIKEQS